MCYPNPDEAENYDFLYGLHRGFRHPFIFEMKHEPEFKALQGNPAFFESGLSRSIPLETENTGSLSHTYC